MKTFPIIIKRFKKNFLWFVTMNYYVEDRRPDLSEAELKNKFKHFLDVRILWWTYNWTFQTEYKYDDLPYQR